MKRFTVPFLTLLLSVAGAFAQSPTAPALNFNVFLENGASLTNNETEGPVAMGGNLTLSGSYQVSTHSVGTYKVNNIPVSLAVGGKIIYGSGQRVQVNNNGYVKIGDSTGSYVWYKDQNNAFSPIRITPGANYNGSPRIELSANAQNLGNVSSVNNPVFQNPGIDFASAFTQLRDNAIAMSTLTDNADLTNPNGNPIPHTNLPNQVKINLNNGINVLNITGADLNACQQFTYNHQPSASKVLIINVNAPGNFNWTVWNQGGFGGLSNCAYILYNFYNTTTLTFNQGNAVEGTVFAPFADIIKTANQSNIQGQVIAKSFIHGGGEVHYPVFTTSIVPTVANFSINNNTQCVNGNSFVFTNSSTGGGTLTYSWNFGDATTSTQANPTKTYASAGTYTVTLTTTGNLGSHTVSKTVTVSSPVVSGFTVNNANQALTGNSFEFTTSSPGSYTYSWDFGDGQSASTTNATHSYAAAGPYTVTQTVSNGGCSSISTQQVIVASDSVNPGNGGGLESESLGDAISKREFNRARNNFNPYINYANEPVFNHTRVFGKKSDLRLADLFPQTLETGDVQRVSTPTDLLDLTIASEVLGVDYTRNNVAKAVVLGIKTNSRAYNHTKSICDRLRGATLLKVDQVTIKGFNFIEFALRQDNGIVEYAIAFVIGKQNNNADYTLQSNWLISTFNAHDAFYNMQVWAARPEDTRKLVGDILDNIQAGNVLNQLNDNHLPVAYATKGSRVQQNLVLEVVNHTSATSGVLKFDQRLSETADYTSLEVEVSLNPNGVTKVEVPVKDGYEYEMTLYINGEKTDEAYLADGNWSLDYDKANTTIDLFDIMNEQNRVYATNEYSIYRGVNLTATTDDYVTLYRPVRAGATPTNLSGYDNFEFTAKGTGKVQIVITKASIIKWDEQYTATVELTGDEKVYTLPLSSFKSTGTNAAFNPNDVKLISFGIEYQQGVSTYNLSLSSVRFTKNASGLLERKPAQASLTAYPNPSNGTFDVTFHSSRSETVELAVMDLTGRLVYTQTVEVKAGSNQVSVTLPEETRGIFFVSLNSASQSFATQKISVK